MDKNLDQANLQIRQEDHTGKLLHHYGGVNHGQALQNIDGEQDKIMGRKKLKM